MNRADWNAGAAAMSATTDETQAMEAACDAEAHRRVAEDFPERHRAPLKARKRRRRTHPAVIVCGAFAAFMLAALWPPLVWLLAHHHPLRMLLAGE